MESFYLKFFDFTYIDDIEKQTLEYEINLCLTTSSQQLNYHVMNLYNKLINFFSNYIIKYTHDETFKKCILYEYIKNTYPNFHQLYLNVMIQNNSHYLQK